MVVDDFNVFRPFGRPPETKPKLIVNSNAVLPFAVTFQRFQPVTWRYTKVIERARIVQHEQLPLGLLPKRPESWDVLSAEKSSGLAASKRSNHEFVR
jgi:hypothetical protein